MFKRRSRLAVNRSLRTSVELLETRTLLAGDLVAQWRADDLGNSLSDQDPVTVWTDSVGGSTANVSDGSPTFIQSAINGRGAVRFENGDGAEGLRVSAVESPMRNRDDFTVVVIFATDSQDLVGDSETWYESSGLVDASNLGFGADWGITLTAEGQVAAGMSVPFVSQTSIFSSERGLNDGQFHTVALRRAGTNLDLYVDNQLTASSQSAPAGPRASIDMAFGMTATGGMGYDGDVAEIRIYDGSLETAELTQLQNEVDGYYDNAQPVANPDVYTFAEDGGPLAGFVSVGDGVLVNDTDGEGDPLTAVLVDGPQHGEFGLNADGSFFYDSDPDFHGTDSFTYVARDFRDSQPTTVTLNVTPVYDGAQAVPDRYKLLAGDTLTVGALIGVLANDQNPDDATLRAVVAQPVSQGALTLQDDGSFVYDPQGFAGEATFEYQIDDGTSLSTPVPVTLVVNTPPEAIDDMYVLDEDVPLITGPQNGVISNDVDAEGDALVATLVESTENGTLTFTEDGSFAYTPDAQFFGTDEFTYVLSDGEDSSAIGLVQLSVTAVNDPPEGVDDTYFGLANEPIVVGEGQGVLANDTDIELDSLQAQLVSEPELGQLQLNSDGSFRYSPPQGFLGTQSFTYRAHDGNSGSEATTVVIAINSLEQQQQVVINEVHIDPDIKTEQVEFIELHNRGDAPVSLAGWSLREAVDFVFPDDASLAPGGYLIVTENVDDFGTKFGRPALGPWNGSLDNDGETIELFTAAGDPIDEVDYQQAFPWPMYGEPGGPSIQLINPAFENDLGGNWRGATPTPGSVNSVLADNAPPQTRRVDHEPRDPQSGAPVTITTLVTDPDGVASVDLSYQLVDPGDYIALDDPRYETQWVTVAMTDDGQAGDETAEDGIYTVVLPGELQTHRRLVRYRIAATDGQNESVSVPYEDDLQPNFAYYVYDEIPSWTGAAEPGVTDPVTYSSELLSSVPVYHLITTHENHVDSQFIPDSDLRSGYTGGDYRWQGTLVYDGQVYDHIGFRARGGVWRYAMGKNMWKFDFHRGHRFQARDEYGNEYSTEWDKLNFSAIIQQGNFRHRGEQGLFESVGFELFDLAGTESPDTHYAHFRLVTDENETGADQYSGDFQGLYLVIEQPDGNFLDQHEMPDGNFYKIEGNRAESVANQGPDQVDDQSDVNVDFIRYFKRNRPEPEWWRENLDLEKYYGYQAISHGIHHYDTAFGKNFYYYSNPETGKWQIHPWDLDLTWANNMFGNENHEFNVQVARNEDFNDYTLQANIDLNNRFNADYQNRTREVVDLLFNPEQTGMLIDQMAAIVYQPDEVSLVDADRAMWDYNPITAERSRYTNNEKNAVRWKFYEVAETNDFAGMIQIMKDYVVERKGWLLNRVLTNEENIPETPTVSYAGDSFELDDLKFATSDFASPIDATFAGMEWRLAETTDTEAPEYDPYDRTQPRVYEINALWESGVLTEFSDSVEIPGHSLEAGKTYRVRARMLDNDGHWSHWSDPVQFQPTVAATSELADSLRISEINYHPYDVTGEERAAGILDADEFEFIEFLNISDQTIDLTSATLERLVVEGEEQGVEFHFGQGDVATLQPGQRVVAVENLEAFRMRYGDEVLVAGQWSGGLSNDSEMVTLADGGLTIQQFAYSDEWYEATDGEGPTLEIVDAHNPDLQSWATADGWRVSAAKGGTPGQDGSTQLFSPGDANQDGLFNSADLVLVFAAGEYEDSVPGNSTWAEGDWNGDGDFDSGDLVFAFASGGYSSEARPQPLHDQALAAALHDLELVGDRSLLGNAQKEKPVWRSEWIQRWP